MLALLPPSGSEDVELLAVCLCTPPGLDGSATATVAVAVTRVGGPDEGVMAAVAAPKRAQSPARHECTNLTCMAHALGGGWCSGEAAAHLNDVLPTKPTGRALSMYLCVSALVSASAAGAP
eukprot:2885730-Pyramimonas_sp.AAC.1